MEGVAQTSLWAYRSIKSDLGDKQQTVFDTIESLGSATNEQIADHLGWPINRVTGRVNELCKMGYVGVEGLAISKSGRPAKRWSARHPEDRKLRQIIEQDCEG